jgi:rRNA biogenesis protein RRP5
LTLEMKYGNRKKFNETVDRACQHNNPKKVYLRVCEMLEREIDKADQSQLATATSDADEMFSKMCKKFKSKKTVWISHLQYLLKSSRHEEAHALLKRSLTSLPEYKHVETMSKFAQQEYEYGSVERARTIFAALFDNKKQRLDLLFVYVDKEIKHGDIEYARNIFEKISNAACDSKSKNRFNDKQMKGLFKKWYRMEDEHGNEESRQNVKLNARAYVERNSS